MVTKVGSQILATKFGFVPDRYWGPKNLTHRGHFSHKLESTHNMPVNQVSGFGTKNCLRKGPKTFKIPYFGLFRDQKFGQQGYFFTYTFDSTHNMPVNQVSESDIKTFLRKWPKTSKIPYFALIQCQIGAKHLAHKTHFSHTLESTNNIAVNQVSWAPIENCLRKWPKTCKISNFDLFFVIRNL